MEKQLTLYSNYGKYDEASFVVASNENLVINIIEKKKANTQYYATIKKDLMLEKIAIKDNFFEIPNKFLTFGTISVKISVYLKGELLKEYACEDLLIKELDNSMICIPEIVALKAELAEQKTLLIDNLTNFKDRISKNEELMAFLCETNIELKGEQND